MNISVSPEELLEHAKKIVEKTDLIEEKNKELEEAMQTLDPWKSENKELFFDDLKKKINDLRAMDIAAQSYGLVASDVASRVMGVENSIRESLIKQQD